MQEQQVILATEADTLTTYLLIKKKWYWGLNLEHCICEASALPLSTSSHLIRVDTASFLGILSHTHFFTSGKINKAAHTIVFEWEC